IRGRSEPTPPPLSQQPSFFPPESFEILITLVVFDFRGEKSKCAYNVHSHMEIAWVCQVIPQESEVEPAFAQTVLTNTVHKNILNKAQIYVDSLLITKRFPFDKRTGVHRRTNLQARDEIAHESTLGVAIVGMEQSGRGKVVNSGMESGENSKVEERASCPTAATATCRLFCRATSALLGYEQSLTGDGVPAEFCGRHVGVTSAFPPTYQTHPPVGRPTSPNTTTANHIPSEGSPGSPEPRSTPFHSLLLFGLSSFNYGRLVVEEFELL
ncbi:hypothetical protein ALC60_06510, partial [Trachymyrmex zeteki]